MYIGTLEDLSARSTLEKNNKLDRIEVGFTILKHYSGLYMVNQLSEIFWYHNKIHVINGSSYNNNVCRFFVDHYGIIQQLIEVESLYARGGIGLV